jgi:succinate dehydrogenase / fumarate reductase cytochrome b subunit
MHKMGGPLGGGKFDPHEAAQSTAVVIQGGLWVAPLYAIGVLACVFHLANGIWTSLITWGITIRPQTQRLSGVCCAVFGVLLALVGLGALGGFRSFDTKSAGAPGNASTQSGEIHAGADN